ncbi:MAG: hypothetical protein GX221_07610 [Candidatus Riflebacteria bacterium]|nr:hypothetical protein [Candidatus Riflebacteria bacterium]
MKYAREMAIILKFWKTSFIQMMEYRANFVFSIIANTIDFIFGLLQYVFFFTVTDNLAGWDENSMLTLYCVFMCVFAVQFLFFYPNLEAISEMVNNGNLDLLLSKPLNTLLLVSFRRISLQDSGTLFAGIALFLWLIISGRLVLTFQSFLFFIFALAASIMIVYSIFLLLISLSIKSEKMEDLASFTWAIFAAARYPVDIFPKKIRIVFLTAIPIGYISSIPAAVLTGKAGFGAVFAALFVSLLCICLSVKLFYASLRNYTSAGG